MQPTNDQMEKMTTSYVQSLTEMNDTMRDTINAVLESVSIMTKGCSDLCTNVSSLMQKQIDQSVKINQAMMSTKDVNDLVTMQNSMIKSTFDSMMMDMNSLSQLSTKIAQDAVSPVTKQVNASLNKMAKRKAA